MRQTEMRYVKTWRLRRRITDMNKALEGAQTHPAGLTRMTVEGIEHELNLIRAELARRAALSSEQQPEGT